LPLESLVSPYVGVVRGVQDVLAGPADARLVTAWCETAHPFAVSGGGSGTTAASARAAAIGEAVERYSACQIDEDSLVVATARELGPAAVDPRRFALFSARQYATPGFPYIAFDADVRVAWIEGVALPDGERAWLPAQLVYLGHVADEPPICRATSSGLACHSDDGEATLSALLEVLERDAFMLTWKTRLSWPLLDWSASDDLAAFERAFIGPTGLRAHAVDLSRVWDVPCAAAVVRSDAPGTAPLGVGAAAGVTIERAVVKALDEATRVRTWADALHRHAMPAPDASDVHDFDDHIRFYADPASAGRVAFLDGSPRRRDVTRVAPLGGESAEERIHSLCARLGRRGASAYAVDVTSPDVRDAGLAVTRVVAPELCALDVEHRAQLLGGRRLYDEPRRLGHRAHTLTEDDVNPDPHPFP
jgi:ribosomal protein S12 methylthiotransferase accessory factor